MNASEMDASPIVPMKTSPPISGNCKRVDNPLPMRRNNSSLRTSLRNLAAPFGRAAALVILNELPSRWLDS